MTSEEVGDQVAHKSNQDCVAITADQLCAGLAPLDHTYYLLLMEDGDTVFRVTTPQIICSLKIFLARTGIEPATLALLAPRSNQLS